MLCPPSNSRFVPLASFWPACLNVCLSPDSGGIGDILLFIYLSKNAPSSASSRPLQTIDFNKWRRWDPHADRGRDPTPKQRPVPKRPLSKPQRLFAERRVVAAEEKGNSQLDQSNDQKNGDGRQPRRKGGAWLDVGNSDGGRHEIVLCLGLVI